MLLPFALLGGWVELRLRRLPTSYSQKRAGFAAAAPRLRALVLGASEAFQGVDASALGQASYSLANVGQSLYYDRQMLAWALPQAPQLEQVALGLSYQSLGYRLPGSPEAWRSIAYYREFGIAPEEGWRAFDLRYFSATLFYEPWPALRWAFSGKGLETPALSPFGQDPLDCPAEDIADVKINALTASRRAATHEALTHLEFIDANLGQLQALKELAQSRGIRLSFFLPPVTASYAQAVDAGRRALMLQRLRAFAAAQGLPLHDYFQDPRFDDGDFFDVDHLCRRGSEKFSRLLAADLGLTPAILRAKTHLKP